MKNRLTFKKCLFNVTIALATLKCGIAIAQETESALIPAQDAEEARHDSAPAAKPAMQGIDLDAVVVTATANPLTSIRSGVSVSILSAEEIQQGAPGNAAEILANVPGILSHSSGGEGNANITARGLPLSGGAKFMQFQEDGLPVFDFGDMDFATADTFVRNDFNVDRLEVIRGGTASTFASNAPGGVFNFISKTGEVEGGNIGLSRGLDFDRTRVDFDYGKPIDERWRFHIGGFYRTGEGPRTVGYTAEKGGQIKGNLTHDFDSGFIRFNFKLLNDRAPVYLPVPVAFRGSDSHPHFDSLPGFDMLDGAMQSKYFRQDLSVDRKGRTVKTDMADGYYSDSRMFGIEMAFDLAQDWKLSNKFRIAANTGRFVGPYPAQVNTAAALAEQIGGAGATLRYATGPHAGQAIADPSTLNGNGLAVRTHLFNTTLNDLGNFANDLKLSKLFKNPHYGDTTLTLGYFKSQQQFDQDWHWNTYLQEVKGKNAALLDVVDSLGNVVTQNGLVAYGEPAWGNCCVRSYKLQYDTDAPYLALGWQKDALNLDGSLRYDMVEASGSYAGATGTRAIDVNGDGVLQTPELTVPVVDFGSRLPVDYTVRYLSYSFGANYLINRDFAVFGRVSRGGRANAERVLFGEGIRRDGSINEDMAVNTVKQYEGGIKWRSQRASLFTTLFHATTTVTDQNITSLSERFTSRIYEAMGIEFEGSYYLNGFSLRGGLTYTDGKVERDDKRPQNVGEQIVPRYMYQLTPSYHIGKLDLGLNFIGLSEFPAVGSGLDTPSYLQVNGFVSYLLQKGLALSITGNNLFNREGITESHLEFAVPGTGTVSARSINGRTLNATLVYSF